MDWTLYAAFVLASAVLIVMPGPNVTLIIAESLSHGRRAGVAVVAGAIGAQALQLLLVVAGLAALVAAYGSAFTVVRWLGAAYLIWMGVMMLRAAGRAGRAAPPSRASSIRRGALVALANPKTLVFHAAFLPQFVDPAAAAAPQLMLLGATFLALALVLDTGWALFAGFLGAVVRRPSSRAWMERVGGLTMIGGGAWLALKRA